MTINVKCRGKRSRTGVKVVQECERSRLAQDVLSENKFNDEQKEREEIQLNNCTNMCWAETSDRYSENLITGIEGVEAGDADDYFSSDGCCFFW